MDIPMLSGTELANKDGNFFCKIKDKDYFASDGIGHSALCNYKDSPAHYKAHLDAPKKDIPAFKIGRAIHCSVLEPDEFSTRYIIAPKLNKNTKKYKEWLAEVPEDREAIDQSLLETAYAMRAKLLFDPELSQYIIGGFPEVAAYCKDPETGILIKAKFDYYLPDRDLIVDLKTTSKRIGSRAFEYSFTDYNYIVQAAYYTHIAEEVTGRPHKFAFLSIETDDPFEAVVSIPDVDTLGLGQKKWMRYLSTHSRCIHNKDWPGYPEKIREYRAPDWAFNQENLNFLRGD